MRQELRQELTRNALASPRNKHQECQRNRNKLEVRHFTRGMDCPDRCWSRTVRMTLTKRVNTDNALISQHYVSGVLPAAYLATMYLRLHRPSWTKITYFEV